jgi:hypothetical protein
MKEPHDKELLERIKKLDAIVSAVTAELAKQREEIQEIQDVIVLIDKRFETLEQARDTCFGVVVAHSERLLALEQKVFPGMWPTIDRVESIVGDLRERHEQHPLDKRKEKP